MNRALFVLRTELFPPAHGGAKNERQLIAALQREGFSCHVLVRALPESAKPHGFAGQHRARMLGTDEATKDRRVAFRRTVDGVTYEGVLGEGEALAAVAADRCGEFEPTLFVAGDDALDDGSAFFEVGVATGNFLYLAQTVHCLPFGPFAMRRSSRERAAVEAARAVLAPSQHVARYVREHAGRNAVVWHPDVFGEPPYPTFGSRTEGFVTMINPCPWKGSSIFLPLARRRTDLQFAAVPTWGASPPVLADLAALPNVTVLPETADVDAIYRQTRVLLVPSICQEAFGLVSPEAMLRGIPVMASDVGGLPESTLGAAALIAVEPLPFDDIPEGAHPGELKWREPANAIEPWSDALDTILASDDAYTERSRRGRAAALQFVRGLKKRTLSETLAFCYGQSRPWEPSNRKRTDFATAAPPSSGT